MFQKKIMKAHTDLDVELKFCLKKKKKKKSQQNQRLKLNKRIYRDTRARLVSELTSNDLSFILHHTKS